MLKENLRSITTLAAFNKITEPELASITVLGEKLTLITETYSTKAHHTLSTWKKTMYELLPPDVKPHCHILSNTRRGPLRTTLEAHLSHIQDRGSNPDQVRANVEALYSLLTPFACFSNYQTQRVTTPLNETIALSIPSSEKRTVFPILRAALPAALSVGSTLRTFGCPALYVTARIARPDQASYRDLGYFVDSQLFHMPEEHVKDSHIYIVEPLIAAGGSVISAAELMLPYHPKSITILSICATTFGLIQVVRNLQQKGITPTIRTIDIGYMDTEGLVRPGFGDIGDRLHGPEKKGMIRSLPELIGTYRPHELDWYQPEIEAIFTAAGTKTPPSLIPPPMANRVLDPEMYDAGPEVNQ